MKRLHEGNINTPEFFNKKFNGTFGLYDMDRLRQLVRYFAGGTYVDVGCMDSIMPVLLAERDHKVFALDFANEIIDFLKPRFPRVNYLHIKDCHSLPFKDLSVDYVVAGEILEHVEEPELFIKECLRILKFGGVLAISTPHDETLANSIGGRQHVWSYSVSDINTMLGGCEIEVINDSILAWRRK